MLCLKEREQKIQYGTLFYLHPFFLLQLYLNSMNRKLKLNAFSDFIRPHSLSLLIYMFINLNWFCAFFLRIMWSLFRSWAILRSFLVKSASVTYVRFISSQHKKHFTLLTVFFKYYQPFSSFSLLVFFYSCCSAHPRLVYQHLRTNIGCILTYLPSLDLSKPLPNSSTYPISSSGYDLYAFNFFLKQIN